MPKRTDLESILIIGSGPIVIGQACEFDYSGTQAVKALKEEGYRVILVNSNPATIMTDPDFADRTYIEPIHPDFIEAIIKAERPSALLPTMGGQTALNATLELNERGVLDAYDCELIGASVDAIKTAEDRELFRAAMDEIGLASASSVLARSVADAEEFAEEWGYPLILRPSRTLGGSGGSIAYTPQELRPKVSHALAVSPIGEVLVEESLLGWKEIELEVMRDRKDNVVVVCTIENFDPMGVHTGDSITVAPIQTLTDKEYQQLRTASIAVMRRIGVDTGGSNVQFALNPEDGRIIIIEMNPRVSRSSALASKATGFPIAKIAAKLAVGYALDEIPNDITRETPACFEPSIDYVVVKIPRFNFEKFPLASPELGTQMKSVGEAMAFGRTFPEALQKAVASTELGSLGFDRERLVRGLGKQELLDSLRCPTAERLWIVGEALRAGIKVETIYKETGIDPWFLRHIEQIIASEVKLLEEQKIDDADLRPLKSLGFTDARLSALTEISEDEIRYRRRSVGVSPGYRMVDTCAAEFEAHTPYLYSSYDPYSEAPPSERKKVIILGSGPNRIGQGIEFDYCCVHAALGLRKDGFETIMVNCNPETVSTDYDISDRLYFEPLTLESVLEIVARENPFGVIVQFGGQTPLKLSKQLAEAGVPILGTSVGSIEEAEDRQRFAEVVNRLGLLQPENASAISVEEALAAAQQIAYPLMIRPSFVLGGRAMRVLYGDEDLVQYLAESVEVSDRHPVLLDRYLHNAIEVDVDAVCDGQEVLISGILEHIERAGVHSGDSSCCIPPQTLSKEVIERLRDQTKLLAKALKVRGLMNVQFAVTRADEVYILEANPRASRTVPFVSKATGVPWAQIAARVMAGQTFSELGVTEVGLPDRVAIKACVFPFNKFSGVDTILGPEMKSTGEVMGLDHDFGGGFAKALCGANEVLPTQGTAFVSVMDGDKQDLLPIAMKLRELGFSLVGTSGTAEFLRKNSVAIRVVKKVREGSPHVVDLLGQGEVNLVINTPEGSSPLLDSRSIRLVANELGIPTFTTIAAASAAAQAIEIIRSRPWRSVEALQDLHADPSEKGRSLSANER